MLVTVVAVGEGVEITGGKVPISNKNLLILFCMEILIHAVIFSLLYFVKLTIGITLCLYHGYS